MSSSETSITSAPQHTASEQSSLSSRVSPVKPLECSNLPSLMKMSSMRNYKMPSSMTLPYDSSATFMKYPLSEASLASLLASRRSHMQHMKQKLMSDMPTFSRQVSFGPHEQSSSMDTSNSSTESSSSHHEAPSLHDEPAPKRRRFQRRNSKTPAMLMSSLQQAADIVAASDIKETKQESSQSRQSLDSGLEIAQELVKQLQLRRQQRNESSK